MATHFPDPRFRPTSGTSQEGLPTHAVSVGFRDGRLPGLARHGAASGRIRGFHAMPVHSQLRQRFANSGRCCEAPETATGRQAWRVQKLRTSFSFCDRLLRLWNPDFLGFRAVSELTLFEIVTRLRQRTAKKHLLDEWLCAGVLALVLVRIFPQSPIQITH